MIIIEGLIALVRAIAKGVHEAFEVRRLGKLQRQLEAEAKRRGPA